MCMYVHCASRVFITTNYYTYNITPLTLSLAASLLPHIPKYYVPQQIGMDDSKHGGQTYPEMLKNVTAGDKA